MFKQLAIAAVGSIALLAGSAQAGAFNQGSLVISAFTNTTTNLQTTTVFNLSPGSITLLNGTQDFSGITPVVQPDGSIDLGNLGTFHVTDPGFGTFAPTSVSVPVYTAATHTLSWTVDGNYTTGADFTNPGTTLTADEAFSLTQVGGPGTAISISATFFSPAQSVPEPMTMTLFGAGLAALGLARRKSK